MKIKLFLFVILYSITTFSQTKLDYQLHEFYDGSNYESTFKTLYQYDTNNHLVLLNHLSRDQQEQTYLNDVKNLYSYDENGNRIESLLYYWDGFQYYLDNKEIFTYNTNNDLIEKNIFDFNGVDFEPSNKIEFIYNENNKLSEYISYAWNGTSFYIEEKSIATFNVDGILAYFITEVGSEVSSLSVYSKEVFTHNVNGKIIERVLYLWDKFDEVFVPDNKKIYNIDANNNLLYSIEYEYDEEFLPLNKYEYVYDFTQLQSNFTDPFNLSNVAFSYLTDIIDFYYLQDYPFYNKILEKNILEYDEFDELFINESRYIYHYNENTASVINFNQSSTYIYPNPTKDKIYIKTKDNTKISNLKLYDNTGKIIINTTLDVINLKLLDSGIYTLLIVDNKGNSFNERIIKL